MSDNYLIFKEENYYFAVDPDSFAPPFNLDGVTVTPAMLTQSLWRYQNLGEKSDQGMFLQVGALFGLTNAILSSEALVFMHHAEGMPPIGLCFSQLFMDAPKKKLSAKLESSAKLYDFPPEMPLPAVRRFFRYKGRRILLIEPEYVFEAFSIIPQGSVINLQKELQPFKKAR